MKALTICQPYAELIATGEKRVENRTWPTHYRGLLAVHAGKSRQWLDIERDDHGREKDVEFGFFLAHLNFGAVIATARLVDCLRANKILNGEYDERYPWLRAHEHVNGPWCWVLEDVKRLEQAFNCNGAQGLWDWIPPPTSSAGQP